MWRWPRGVAALALLIGLQFALTFASVRSDRVQGWAKGEPTLLLHEGRMLAGAMRKARVTPEEAAAAARQNGLPGPEAARAVVLETDGSLSVIGRKQEKMPPTGGPSEPAGACNRETAGGPWWGLNADAEAEPQTERTRDIPASKSRWHRKCGPHTGIDTLHNRARKGVNLANAASIGALAEIEQIAPREGDSVDHVALEPAGLRPSPWQGEGDGDLGVVRHHGMGSCCTERHDGH